MPQLTVRMNIRSKDFETRIYFIIFFLFSSFLALQIHNLAFDVLIAEPEYRAQYLGVLRPHLQESVN